MNERVVVTGIGIVSSIGLGVETFSRNLKDGVNGKAPLTAFNSSGFDRTMVCEVKQFDAAAWAGNTDVSRIGRSSQYALAAARMALQDAGIGPEAIGGREVPVIFGTTDGESVPFETIGRQLFESANQSFDASLLRQVPAQEIALTVAREFGLSGEALTISTACAAGNYALGTGFDMVSLGETEIALCGGSDSVCRKTFAGFYRLGNMAHENCQPFDVDRTGILVGEGSAVLILESLSAAMRRNAPVYAEMLGYAINCDAEHMVAPNMDSIARCMRLAHHNAGITAAEVDYVCMHGTGTKANDTTEVAAVKAVFGENAPPVSSIKSGLGHGMGAASAFGAAACCLAIRDEFLPPTINLVSQDPECDVDVVANVHRPAKPQVVQNDAFAFGGNNAISIFRNFIP